MFVVSTIRVVGRKREEVEKPGELSMKPILYVSIAGTVGCGDGDGFYRQAACYSP